MQAGCFDCFEGVLMGLRKSKPHHNRNCYGDDGLIDVISTHQVVDYEPVHRDAVTCIAVFSEGFCLSGSADRTLALFNLRSGVLTQRWRGHDKEITKVVVSKEEIIYSSSRDKTIKLWKIGDGSSGEIATYEGHKLVVTGIDLNSDETLLFSGSRDNSVRLWDVNIGDCIQESEVTRNLISANTSVLQGIRWFFYAASPTENSFVHVKDVPDYLNDAIPLFLGAVVLEYIIASFKGLPRLRLNDSFSSVSAGFLMQLTKLVFLSTELAAYTYVYNHYRLVTLPWDSFWTWYLCAVGVDFFYYWFHRAAHEINIMWAAHQVHHSSEEYNLTTALRQSVVQNYTSWCFYLPMALGIPPSIFLVHAQFTMLYQFWIHTEVVQSLGPLEYIFNSPSHHRVHHGRNPYCIDKNYGGTLIIWDRLFGTFQEETSEELAYGLVHPLSSWNPLWTQLCHYHHIWNTFWATEGLKNKLFVLIKGPGWMPGQPRLGNPDDIPKIEYPIVKYDVDPGFWGNVYAVCHSLLFLVAYQQIIAKHMILSQFNVWAVVIFLILTLTSIGALFDCKWYAPYLEFSRCLLFLLADVLLTSLELNTAVLSKLFLTITRASFIGSTFLWMFVCMGHTGKVKKS